MHKSNVQSSRQEKKGGYTCRLDNPVKSRNPQIHCPNPEAKLDLVLPCIIENSHRNRHYNVTSFEITNKMSDRALQHRRIHNLFLIQKLFSGKSDASPFTLVLDSVEQSAKPLIDHYINNARVSSPHSPQRTINSSFGSRYRHPKQTSSTSRTKH